jgi:hypothetical protein
MNIFLSLGLGWLLGSAIYGFLLFAPYGVKTMAMSIKIIAAALILLCSINLITKTVNFHGAGSEHISNSDIYIFGSFTFILNIVIQILIHKMNPEYNKL